MDPTPNHIFTNDSFLAVDKPAGWLSVPSRTGAADPRPCLGIALEKEWGVRLWPVHRLDEEVTGVILFAKTAAAHRLASGWFEGRTVHKTYEALTETRAAAPEGPQIWESSLLRGKKRAYESPHGKSATTRARVSGARDIAGQASLLWELEPVTGRPHQLRFELARHGFPILGDALYGADRAFFPDTIALRCVRLDLSAAPERLGLPVHLSTSSLTDFTTAKQDA